MLPIASRRQAAALVPRRTLCCQVASCRSRRSRCSSRRPLHASSIATAVFPGQATPEGTARFLAEHPQNQGVSSDKDRLLTVVNPKTRLEVNALACGLPRLPDVLNDSIPSALTAAVVLGGLNLVQVFDSRNPAAGAGVRRALQTIFDCGAATRSQLVTWAMLDPTTRSSSGGGGVMLGDGQALRRSIDEARAATGLETLDMAVIRLDLTSSPAATTGPTHPRGRMKALLAELHDVMEQADALCCPTSTGPVPIQAYGFDLLLSSSSQPKTHTAGAAPPPPTAAEAEEEQMLALVPTMLEEAARVVQGNKLAVLSIPMHITDRVHVWSGMEEEDKAEGGGSKGKRKRAERDPPAAIRMARGPLLGYAGSADGGGAAHSVRFSTQFLPADAVSALGRTLEDLAPALRSTKLLEAKILRTLLAQRVDVALLDMEDVLGLLKPFLVPEGSGRGGLRRHHQLLPREVRAVSDFHLPLV